MFPIIASAVRRLPPAARARSVARWITGPSASGSENVLLIGVGLAAGAVGVGAVVDVLSISNQTTASIGSSATVHAGGNVLVSAVDNTNVLELSGALAGGFVGVGGAVGVMLITKVTDASIGANANVEGLGNGAAASGTLNGVVAGGRELRVENRFTRVERACAREVPGEARDRIDCVFGGRDQRHLFADAGVRGDPLERRDGWHRADREGRRRAEANVADVVALRSADRVGPRIDVRERAAPGAGGRGHRYRVHRRACRGSAGEQLDRDRRKVAWFSAGGARDRHANFIDEIRIAAIGDAPHRAPQDIDAIKYYNAHVIGRLCCLGHVPVLLP